MKKEERMIDALLQEHARHGAGPDEAFLQELEQQLDADNLILDLPRADERVRSNGRHWGLGLAAAIAVSAVGYYGWQQQRANELALNDTYTAIPDVGPLASADGEVTQMPPALDPSGDSVVGNPVGVSLRPELKKSQNHVAEEVGLGIESQADQNLKGTAAGASVGKDAPGVRRKPSAPSTSLGKVIAASSAANTQADFASPPQENEWRSKGRRLTDKEGLQLSQAPVPQVAPMIKKSVKSQRSLSFHTGRHSEPRPLICPPSGGVPIKPVRGAERYGQLHDNPFCSPWKTPLSTFSVDVDTASYTNMRRMIQSGQSIPVDAVRIEEMINYFDYAYPQPEAKHPFSVHVETASCPWNEQHRLVKIGLQGKDIIREKRPAANLVFLLDVSGSMNSQDKLPLLVDSMKILLKELNGDDSVSIVVYAGAQGLALPPTFVDDTGRETILKTLTHLQSGGSTNGGAGIELAYAMAKKQFVQGGVNRVILGTDGDFNVGMTDKAALISMVQRQARSGVFLSVLGFGRGNLNDSMLEAITNKGNGNYSYIDNLSEGRKVFLDDMMGNMVTIAKDVKIQVEFNPAKVRDYRLIGYANRMLKAEDFKNKRIDAGEIGAGHTVTALYEIIPGEAGDAPVIDGLKYQKNEAEAEINRRVLVESREMLTVKLAYKQPDATKETESTYFNTAVTDSGKAWAQASEDFKFASSVGLFGMLKRQSQNAGQGDYALVQKLAEQGRGKDAKGRRTEFSDMVRKSTR